MASLKEPSHIPCKFEEAWVGACNKKTDNGWCDKHATLTCSSCGEKAVRSCDHTSSPVCCGASLCATCKHSRTGEHITHEAYEEELRVEREEKQARVQSRTSKTRRYCPKRKIPLNTFELRKGDWEAEGYRLIDCFFLLIDHRLAGVHPAVVKTMQDSKGQDLMIFTIDRSVIVEFWKLLPPERSKIDSQLGYVNTEEKVLYPHSSDADRFEVLEPQPYFDSSDLEMLRQNPEDNLGWAPGVFGCGVDQASFLRLIERSEPVLV